MTTVTAHTKYKNLKAVFEAHVTVTINTTFVTKVLTFGNAFIRRDENSINCFGGGLIGAYTVIWLPRDTSEWLEEVLGIEDMLQLTTDVHNLPNINKNFNVSASAINFSFIWVAHKALSSTTLNQKEKELLSKEAINILQYKFFSSLHNHRFKYPANIGAAQATYESLDNKSQLKRVGSWKALIDLRTADILKPHEKYHNYITNLDNDYSIVKMVNDIWNRLKSILNLITSAFYKVHKNGEAILSGDKFVEVDGDVILKDSKNQYTHIKSVMQTIISDRNGFIKEPLIKATSSSFNTVNPDLLRVTLIFMSQNHNVTNKGFDIHKLLDDILMFTFSRFKKANRPLKDIVTVTQVMRGVIRSSRIGDPDFDRIKEELSLVIELANPHISTSNLVSTRIGVLFYIILLAVIKN